MCAETKRRRILVVDDDTSFLRVMCHKLESAGYEVRGFETAIEAGNELDRFSPDLVIVDRWLPTPTASSGRTYKGCIPLYAAIYRYGARIARLSKQRAVRSPVRQARTVGYFPGRGKIFCRRR